MTILGPLANQHKYEAQFSASGSQMLWIDNVPIYNNSFIRKLVKDRSHRYECLLLYSPFFSFLKNFSPSSKVCNHVMKTSIDQRHLRNNNRSIPKEDRNYSKQLFEKGKIWLAMSAE
ncbi:hypothetical protein RO3G_09992 [Rhizopus delemar RA 99-880]|uniref:Uncharacterized protein n=1 Tax=Rhizopus delemar (strain RA 99-880 / ATCC MYA-4621 / FGSC 9543 / NRRL 43880) TaxID=246409 RepID=I1CA02_RHIO9|nr:hypothetical protein RO3G_09992 [Rhizopus delemar RA 99-880]|eukprot:EIE85282.1 hypothetical protein RO3G_09992 [Rhizopus delemar RA 99-880]